MPFTFTLPQTGLEALTLLVPFLTALLGLGYLIAPRTMLASAGMEAKPDHPDAVGEGRSAHGGILLAFGLCCLLLQEPKALQPGLNAMLAIAWFISGAGFVLQILIDGQRRVGTFVRLGLAFAFSMISWWTSDPVTFGLVVPSNSQEWIIAGLAAFTIALGLISLLSPRLSLRIMRLRASATTPMCICGPRGVLGGFYIAAGLGLFIVSAPAVAAIWLQMLLGASWLFTGLGRVVAMIFDPGFLKGFTPYNLGAVVLELGIGGYILGTVFGVI